MKRRDDSLFLKLFGFGGMTIGSIWIISILANIFAIVALICGIWWCYNHMIAPSFDIPKIEVHK